MRRLLISMVLLSATAACGSDARVPTGHDVSLAATAIGSTTRVPVDLVVFVPCGGGEDVALSGWLNVASQSVENGAGGFRVVAHINPQGVAGVGLTSGNQYRGTGATTETFGGGPGFTFTSVNRFHLVATGKHPSFSVLQVVHFTITPTGEVTAVVNHQRVECR